MPKAGAEARKRGLAPTTQWQPEETTDQTTTATIMDVPGLLLSAESFHEKYHFTPQEVGLQESTIPSKFGPKKGYAVEDAGAREWGTGQRAERSGGEVEG